MGQATVDLPDPLDVPPAASLSGTDDLLAQLAGDEIDRLLAEANEDAAQPPGAAAAAPVAAPVADAAGTPVADAAAAAPAGDASSTNATSAAAAAAAPASPAAPAASTPAEVATAAAAPSSEASAPPAPSEVKVDDELDALLSELTLKKSPASAPGSPGAVADATAPTSDQPGDAKSLTDRVPEVLAEHGTAPASPAGIDATTASAAAAAAAAPVQAQTGEPAAAGAPTAGADASVAATPDMLMSAAERDALSLSDLAAEADAATEQDAADAADRAAEDRLAPAIKLLELINAPVSFIPDALRDALGKVAILTLVNALAVLIYVLFVRQ